MTAPATKSSSCSSKLLLLLLLVFSVTLPAASQETGKIEGRVVDTNTAQPLAGVQVYVAGTRLGNLTNTDGYYYINNVPAGLQDVRAQFIGHQTVTFSQQRILAGQTTTLDFRLAQAPIEIVALEIVGEKQPLVPRDQITSKNIITGDVIQGVDNVTALVRMQPGVVSHGRKNGISIRGGRVGEEAVFVDGVLVRNFAQGQSNLIVATNAITEVDVITGGFGAEYGDAQSGIINYVTRTGGRQWSGTGTFMTDAPVPKRYSVGYNRLELSAGGPLAGPLGFFAAVTATGQASPDLGRGWRTAPIYLAQGIDTMISYDPDGNGSLREVPIPNFVLYNQAGRIPYANTDEYTADTKVDYTYGAASRVFISAQASRRQARNPFGGTRAYLFDSQGFGGTLTRSTNLTLGWTHTLFRGSGSGISLDLKVVRSDDYLLSGNLDPEFDLKHRNPPFAFTVPDFKFQVDDRTFPVNQELVDKWLAYDQTREGHPGMTPYAEDRKDLNCKIEFRLNPYSQLSNFCNQGVGGIFGYVKETQWQYRGTLDWQADPRNRIKIGADHYDIALARAYMRYNDAAYGQLFVEHPNRQSVFAQERLDLGDIVVEAGLRFDRFDPNSNFPKIAGYLVPDDPATYERAPVRIALSPRLGVALPVTAHSTFRLSYGHFAQVPDLNVYYRGKNIEYARNPSTNTNDYFGRPLQLARTVAFEFGYRGLLAPDVVLDVAVYNRDKQRDVSMRKMPWENPENPGEVNYLNTLTNSDFGTVRGLDARLDLRLARVFYGAVTYSYQDARNTGSDPFTFANVFARLSSNAATLLNLPPNPAEAMRPTEENRKHNFAGFLAVQWPAQHGNRLLANLAVNVNARLLSGLAYTPLAGIENGAFMVAGEAGNAPLGLSGTRLRDDDILTARMPWQKYVDLRIQKGVRLGGWNARLFLDANNVFDFKNQTSIFQTTGDTIDEDAYAARVQSDREILGGGVMQAAVDLHTIAPGGGVRNPVDLYLLQKAEARYGNGDMMFTADEQTAAFKAGWMFLLGPQDMFGPGRRLRVGIELSFDRAPRRRVVT